MVAFSFVKAQPSHTRLQVSLTTRTCDLLLAAIPISNCKFLCPSYQVYWKVPLRQNQCYAPSHRRSGDGNGLPGRVSAFRKAFCRAAEPHLPVRLYFGRICSHKSVLSDMTNTMEQSASHMPAHIRRGEWTLQIGTNFILEREHFLRRLIEKEYVHTDISTADC